MTNLDALSAKCTALCSGFYPDAAILEFELFDMNIDASHNYSSQDTQIAELAIKITSSMVENSRSEGGISSSYDRKSVERNIIRSCREYGLDASKFLTLSTISDASDCW